MTSLLVVLMVSCAASRKERRARAYDITQAAYEQYWGRDWQKLVEMTTEAIAVAPDMSWPYSLRGVAYNALSKPDLALEDFDRALELNPFFVEAFVNRARTHLMSEEYARAKADLMEALKLAPGDMEALVSMSAVYSLEDNVEKACQYMNMALEAGFRELDVVEQEGYFGSLMTSDCYSRILDELAPVVKE